MNTPSDTTLRRPVLAIRGLVKRYGSHEALRGLTLSVRHGDIYGLIGPNGAGKTTTMKIIATILKSTAGKAVVSGMDLNDPENLPQIRKKIGYMPDAFGVYEDMTASEYLNFFAATYNIGLRERRTLVDDVLELVDLADRRHTLVDSLSRGTQQRLAIGRVLIHNPDLLILDEPASGLDPRARVEIRALLLELQKMGKTILISSHILADIGEICNRVGLIVDGKNLVEDTIPGLLSRLKPSPIVHIQVRRDVERAAQVLRNYPPIVDVHVEGLSLVVTMREGFTDVWQIADVLINSGLQLMQLKPESRSLEHAYLSLTEDLVE